MCLLRVGLFGCLFVRVFVRVVSLLLWLFDFRRLLVCVLVRVLLVVGSCECALWCITPLFGCVGVACVVLFGVVL